MDGVGHLPVKIHRGDVNALANPLFLQSSGLVKADQDVTERPDARLEVAPCSTSASMAETRLQSLGQQRSTGSCGYFASSHQAKAHEIPDRWFLKLFVRVMRLV